MYTFCFYWGSGAASLLKWNIFKGAPPHTSFSSPLNSFRLMRKNLETRKKRQYCDGGRNNNWHLLVAPVRVRPLDPVVGIRNPGAFANARCLTFSPEQLLFAVRHLFINLICLSKKQRRLVDLSRVKFPFSFRFPAFNFPAGKCVLHIWPGFNAKVNGNS